jgi:hypothetical protein
MNTQGKITLLFNLKKILFVAILSLATNSFSWGQKEGSVESAEITIEKDRKVILPDAVKPKEKPVALKNDNDAAKQVFFDIADRKIKVPQPKMNLEAQNYEPQDTSITVYENFVRLGAGNFGRLYAEGLVSTPAYNMGQATLYFKNNSASRGPKLSEISGNSQTEIGLSAKYVNDWFKLNAALDYDRFDYRFYGFKVIPGKDVSIKDIRQTLNKVGFNIGFENSNRESALDYDVTTGINILNDRFETREVEWISKGNFTLPVTENFYALVDANTFITQRTDSVANNRNLIKIRPSFILKYPSLAITFGLNVASERDVQKNINKNINRTRAFPLINIDYYLGNGLYTFMGFEGDIYRNSLNTLLLDNQWLGRKINLLNTEKSADIFAGLKGSVLEGLNFDLKLSYGRFKNYAVFNNMNADTSKFEVLYNDSTLTNIRVNGNLYYKVNNLWNSILKLESNSFAKKSLLAMYHVPNLKATWSNTLAFSQKLFIGTDVYFLSKMNSLNPSTNKLMEIKPILDLNAKMNYQFSKHLSSFVYLNNILGKNYQRYQYYPLQSLNFLVGLSYGFSTNEIF